MALRIKSNSFAIATATKELEFKIEDWKYMI